MTPLPADENRAVPVANRRSRARLCALAVTAISAIGAGALAAPPAFADTPATGVVSNGAHLSGAGEAKSIAEVQGTTDVSPFVDQTVTVQGVVTGDYRTGGYKGITIQTQGTGETPRPTARRTASSSP